MNRGRNNMNENSIKKESGEKKYKHSRRRGGAPRDGGTSGVPRGSAGVPPRDGGTSGVPPPNGGSFARCVVPGVGGGGNRSGSGTRKQKDNTKSKNRSTRGGGSGGGSGGGGGGSGGSGGGSGGGGVGGGGVGGGGGGGGSGGGGGGVSVVADVSGHGNVIKTNPFLVALLSKPEPVKNNDRYANDVFLTSGPFSVSCWVRTDEIPESNVWWTFLHQGNYNAYESIGFGFSIQPIKHPWEGRVTFETYNNKYTYSSRLVSIPSKQRVDSGRWNHLVGLFASGKLAFYFNGLLQGEVLAAYQSISNRSSISIGNPVGYPLNGFRGNIDEVRVYNRALSVAEIRNIYAYEMNSMAPRASLAKGVVVNGFLVGVEMMDEGFGYDLIPLVKITGGGGIGAAVRAVVADGKVNKIIVEKPGSGYTSSPSIIIDRPAFPVRRAQAISEVKNGEVSRLNMTDLGYGYENPPVIFLIGGGGSGAKATALVENGVVVDIRIIESGSGYTSPPTVAIASPPFSPKLSIEFTRVKVTLEVVLGKKYQLESSADLVSWRPAGIPFIALSEKLDQEFDVESTGRYFRVQMIQ